MDEKQSYLPGRTVEKGIQLFSSSNELDLIREWLPNAPDEVQIVRVSHRRFDHSDSDFFTISCKFGPPGPIDTMEEARRLLGRWARHIAPFDLPDKTWIGPRDISLSWEPERLASVYLDELPTHERVQHDLNSEVTQGLTIWTILHGSDPDKLARYLGGSYEAKCAFLDLGPVESADGLELTQEGLDDSILDDCDIWLHFLGLLKKSGIDAPLLDRFQKTFLRLKLHPDLPDLSRLASQWDVTNTDFLEFSPEDQSRASDLVQITIRELDALLSPSLAEVNQLLELVDEPEDLDLELPDDDNSLPLY